MMMTGAPIKLTQADAADVADLYNRCSDYFLLQDGAAPTLDDARELFSDVPPEKSAHNQAVLGWKGPGGLYAIAAILRDYPRDGTWYLGFMIVDAAQRGRGVGRSIYSTVESWAAARGATEIRLAVLEANEAAERFWRSLGFIEYRRVGPDTFKMRRPFWRDRRRQQQVRSRAGYLGELGVGFRPLPQTPPFREGGLRSP